ncbi:MAG: response regulator transcription factor [Saprospiraceae bacterium]|nr:response regulator transcription factor [Saprospiraceae bacterium]MCF8251371.1 response regulator transcription factor [Saprospiraceae bacterium]MCF8280546.1 response regulator transcription factor [Bacteroidales bacterium]MCF8313236.1 response regulator transcription factor [Saprospiraceae bacterium]MCF8441683.1 response regulator transcription factor [Saprospiraceae bacterium]
MSSTRILLADDHQMFRTGVATLLAREASFKVVGEAKEGDEVVRLACQLQPDVIVMDIHLPVMDGIAATRKIIAEFPAAKILALTSFETEDYVVNMLRAGAKGYILKEAPIEELVLAIKTIANGSSYFAKEISVKIFAMLENVGRPSASKEPAEKASLTERELEILEHIAAERTNKEIAAVLFISPRTVETHRRNLIHKLKVKNTAGLMKFYLSNFKNKGEFR